MSGAVRRAVHRLADELAVFSSGVEGEVLDLRRNVDNQPITGATCFRHCLEDLDDRLASMAEELEALEAVSTDATSLQELVDLCNATYTQNHFSIVALEERLASYGYTEAYEPVPPENPRDLVDRPAREQRQGAAAEAGYGSQDAADAPRFCGEGSDCGAEAGEPRAALEALTNRVDAGAPPGTAQRSMAAAALQAMAPMTAAKALAARRDTPSSLASSPELMSPSMQELLGKYGSVSPSLHRSRPTPARRTGTPYAAARGGGLGPTPSPLPYLSPAFMAAAAEQDAQLWQGEGGEPGAVPAAPPAAAAAPSGTPETGGFTGNPEMMEALTATARKLGSRPSFMDHYRQKFPHIVASTERLLASVDRHGAAAAAAAAARGGPVAAQAKPDSPMAALAAAATAARTGAGSAAAGTAAAPPQPSYRSYAPVEEPETTMELYSSLISGRFDDGAAAAPAATPALPPPAALSPSTQALLSRAAGRGGVPEPAPSSAAAARAAPAEAASGSAALSERSRPALNEAIAAALKRNPAPAPAPEAAAPLESRTPAAPAAAAPPAAGTASRPASVVQPWASRPAPPPTPAAAGPVPDLRPVPAEEFEALPTFIRAQLPLEALNAALSSIHAGAAAAGGAAFGPEELEAAGLEGPRGKVFVNSLVKLGRAQLRVVHGQGTSYLLV